ncbi:hypothetical protein MNAN1_002064 [Malassezia nana]|uniref:Uncharacterized protein n=1 Tax=Malassezia nana TaxID=180528 RepID=A0AAF0J3P3_9BASI|nr:hypothetical protein MNAN1_002064 [Malassezia nana]
MQVSDESPGLTDLHWLAKAERLCKKKAKEGTVPLSKRLTWLNVAGNAALGERDDSLDALAGMEALHVLNASRCALRLFPPAMAGLRSLKALVLSHNQLSALPAAFPHLPELNTLVLSNNAFTELPITLPSSLPNLKKLSVGHNRLTCAGLPDLSVCAHLREVRLSGNPTLHALPSHLASWGRGVDGGAPGLVLLDVSDCGLDSWEAVQPLLAMPHQERHGLANLGAKGNRIADHVQYRDTLCQALPSLRILDTVRLVPKKTTTEAEAQDAPNTSSVPEPALPEAETLPTTTKASSSLKRRRDETASAPTDPFFAPPTEAEPKKVRKRSGRGPKRRAHAPTEAAPVVPAPSHVRRSPSPPMDAPPRPPEPQRPAASRKTRRKKTTRAVELDMDAPATDSTPPAAPRVRTSSPSPPPTTHADTGVVQIVDVARPVRKAGSAATLLGRRTDEWSGW